MPLLLYVSGTRAHRLSIHDLTVATNPARPRARDGKGAAGAHQPRAANLPRQSGGALQAGDWESGGEGGEDPEDARGNDQNEGAVQVGVGVIEGELPLEGLEGALRGIFS